MGNYAIPQVGRGSVPQIRMMPTSNSNKTSRSLAVVRVTASDKDRTFRPLHKPKKRSTIYERMGQITRTRSLIGGWMMIDDR